jgi:hypothetical protein
VRTPADLALPECIFAKCAGTAVRSAKYRGVYPGTRALGADGRAPGIASLLVLYWEGGSPGDGPVARDLTTLMNGRID